MDKRYKSGYAAGYAKGRAFAPRLTEAQVWLSVYTAAVGDALVGNWSVGGGAVKKQLLDCCERMIVCRDAADAAVKHAKERGYI